MSKILSELLDPSLKLKELKIYTGKDRWTDAKKFYISAEYEGEAPNGKICKLRIPKIFLPVDPYNFPLISSTADDLARPRITDFTTVDLGFGELLVEEGEEGWAFKTEEVTPETIIKDEGETKMDFNTVDGRVSLHSKICEELTKLYERKNHDYGDSFHKTYVEEGMAMSRIRLDDKLNRFKTLSRGAEQTVGDESIRDTLIDLANYAIMTVMEMDREKTEKMSELSGTIQIHSEILSGYGSSASALADAFEAINHK